MRIRIISPERDVFDGEATALVAPAYDGEVGILPRHAPFMTLLGSGLLRVRTEGGERRFAIRGGVLKVKHNAITVVAEEANAVT